ncbi:MAG TPA: 50S ribosomal protein L9 [Acidobacteriota bacterium]|mgnify:CR=1 FL=1|nr:50S ribosomal protein L9 [bacterium]HNX19229.1 50S ribosomal protein L9 [Acidobacteriota bacterium]
MQIILREDVEHVGKRGDVVKVADGFARNYLIPKKLAYLVTPGVRKQVESEARAKVARENRARTDAEAIAARLRELTVLRFARMAGESGALFGSVTNIDVAEALIAQGFEVDRKQVRLDEPIKRVGTHRVTVHIFKDVAVDLVVEVEAEGTEQAAQ